MPFSLPSYVSVRTLQTSRSTTRHSFWSANHSLKHCCMPELSSNMTSCVKNDSAQLTHSQRFKVPHALLIAILCLIHSTMTLILSVSHSTRTLMEFQISHPFINATVHLTLLLNFIPNGTLHPANLLDYLVLEWIRKDLETRTFSIWFKFLHSKPR